MSTSILKYTQNRGFSLVEMMIALLIFSALGFGMTAYLRRSQSQMRQSALADDVRLGGSVLQSMITNDIRQAVFVNPSCDTNNTAASLSCSNVKIRGGVTPLPGQEKSDLDSAMTSSTAFSLPANLTSAQSSLTKTNDALRLVIYDFSSTYNCKLNRTHTGGSNPAPAGTETMWASASLCAGKLAQGGLYVLVETNSTNTTTYSNVFQITNLGTANMVTDDWQIDMVSNANRYNQTGGMGGAAFSSAARIYPVKFVEWAVSPNNGVYRREIRPNATGADSNGYLPWVQVQANIETLQFEPVTMNGTGAIVHHRTMSLLDSTVPTNNGIEDIRGVNPHYVVKSLTATTENTRYDNPITPTNENDAFPRREYYFFIDLRNYI